MWKRGGQEKSISQIPEPKLSLQLWVLEIGECKKLHSQKLAVKGNKAGRKKGCIPFNKGKVRITQNGKIRYVDDQQLAEIYYGVS